MAEPTQAEIDAVAKAIKYMHPLTISSSRDRARIAIQALNKVRGECVPVDVLIKKVREQWGRGHFVEDWFTWWIERKGWLDGLDDKTPAVQTERRKP